MIGPEAKKSVMESLDADVAFLAKNQIMDYSLILGKVTKIFLVDFGLIVTFSTEYLSAANFGTLAHSAHNSFLLHTLLHRTCALF